MLFVAGGGTKDLITLILNPSVWYSQITSQIPTNKHSDTCPYQC